MVQFLLIGQDVLLYLVQPLQQQVGHQEYDEVSRHEETGDVPVYLPDKVQAEQNRGNQVPDHAEPEAIEDAFSRIGSVFNLLYQLPRSQLLSLDSPAVYM